MSGSARVARKYLALVRGSNSTVSVCRRTGVLRSRNAPKLEYERAPAAAAAFTLSDSLAYIERALTLGEMKATEGVEAALNRLRELEELQELQELEGQA